MELLVHKEKILHLKVTNSFLYNHVCAHLKSSSDDTVTRSPFLARALLCSEAELSEKLLLHDRAQRVKHIAKQLQDGGFPMDAAALLVSLQSFHRELSTLNDALTYATKLFFKQ